jgi:cytochrome c biogenesis factor
MGVVVGSAGPWRSRCFLKSLPLDMVARVLSVLGLISVGFLLFILTTSNPFERLLPAALDGRDLNPLLQDPGLVIHPPMLYMGYVGMFCRVCICCRPHCSVAD